VKTLTLVVNGDHKELEIDPDTPLLWVLRDQLSLTGTKFGCGRGQCGACTVHVGDAPMRSCLVPVSAVANRPITTIEGASSDVGAHLQRAWVEEQVPQCGYCQPGMIMTAAALLQRVPRPADKDIDEALAGHICRCGTYSRIRRAIHLAATWLEQPNAPGR
jgi:isoquinoline 1-oxidoreductase subunit alpha